MKRRTYTIAFFYSLFAYFLFLPVIHGNRDDFLIPSLSHQTHQAMEFASAIYSKISPQNASLPIRASPREIPLVISPPPTLEEIETPIATPAIPMEPTLVAPPVVIATEASSIPAAQEPTPIAAPLKIVPNPTPVQINIQSVDAILQKSAEPIVQKPREPVEPIVQKPILAIPSSELATKEAAFSLRSSPPPSPKPSTHKMKYPVPKRLILSHDGGYGDDSGVAYGDDYTTLGIFLASDYTVGSFYPFIDLRGHRFDNDSYAFSVGAGTRYIPPPDSFCEMLGLNVYYDWRQGFLNEYNQLGVGMEVLGRRWDFRANGYFPVGAKSFQHTCVFNEYTGDYVIENRRQEITTYGFNAEVGWLAVNSKNFLLYFAAGPYYLTTQSNCFDFEPIRGGRIRARPQYKDYFAVDVSFSHDSTFNTVWQTTFILSIPLYQITNQNERPCRMTDRQIYQPVERFEVMSLGTRSCWWQNF